MLSQPSHWARPAGWVGIITGAMVLTFGAVSAATSGDTALSISSGAIALLTAAVGAPLVAVGAASARFDASLTGLAGVRIAGWVGYGLAMATGAAMIISGFFITYPAALILAVAGLGAASLACLSVDAFASAGQAEEFLARAPPPSAAGPSVVPTFALARQPNGAMVPPVVLAGAF